MPFGVGTADGLAAAPVIPGKAAFNFSSTGGVVGDEARGISGMVLEPGFGVAAVSFFTGANGRPIPLGASGVPAMLSGPEPRFKGGLILALFRLAVSTGWGGLEFVSGGFSRRGGCGRAAAEGRTDCSTSWTCRRKV